MKDFVKGETYSVGSEPMIFDYQSDNGYFFHKFPCYAEINCPHSVDCVNYEPKEKPLFADLKVGDYVYSERFGVGEVYKINTDLVLKIILCNTPSNLVTLGTFSMYVFLWYCLDIIFSETV